MADSSDDLRRSLRVLRAERDLTQKALAEAADLSPAYVSQIESG
ncbi:MAG: helix-turn-helix transcriptional regulator, partial [Actinobacteria bacterium]|nr:helix-turn-helix transcriptional regulator [Actinomycetota bacterium]